MIRRRLAALAEIEAGDERTNRPENDAKVTSASRFSSPGACAPDFTASALYTFPFNPAVNRRISRPTKDRRDSFTALTKPFFALCLSFCHAARARGIGPVSRREPPLNAIRNWKFIICARDSARAPVNRRLAWTSSIFGPRPFCPGYFKPR